MTIVGETAVKVRLQAGQLSRNVRFGIRLWNAHMRTYALKAYPEKGDFARRFGHLSPESKPTGEQKLLSMGASHLDATMAHLLQAYQGCARLLTGSGGLPLPWSAMVLARTALEGSLCVMNVLERPISDELRLARMAARQFESIAEAEKMEIDLGLKRLDICQQNQQARSQLEAICVQVGLTPSKTRRGSVRTSAGEIAAFPLNVSEAAKLWWDPHGVHAFRWLSGFTHGNPHAAGPTQVSVAAIRIEDAFAIYNIATDAVWTAMDSYARWVGFPDQLVMVAMRRIQRVCAKPFPGRLPLRPATDPGEITVRRVFEAARGIAPDAVIDRTIRAFTRRL